MRFSLTLFVFIDLVPLQREVVQSGTRIREISWEYLCFKTQPVPFQGIREAFIC